MVSANHASNNSAQKCQLILNLWWYPTLQALCLFKGIFLVVLVLFNSCPQRNNCRSKFISRFHSVHQLSPPTFSVVCARFSQFSFPQPCRLSLVSTNQGPGTGSSGKMVIPLIGPLATAPYGLTWSWSSLLKVANFMPVVILFYMPADPQCNI